jgi:4-amino-4-deoxy-L-arabinose transferase-like glycosyltransferase
MAALDTDLDGGRTWNAYLNPAFAGKDFTLSGSSVKALYWTLVAFLAVRLLAMVTVPFTDTTEARYGEIARKMVETGNWITPQFDYGVPFWGKPPLHTWLAAGGMEFFGVSEFAARLPIFLTSFAVLLLVYIWVADIAGRNTALLSVVVLSSMGLFFGASAFVMTDMPMVLGTTLVMVAFWNAICRDAPGKVWGLGLFVGLAIGLLAKGPVAAVLCLLPIVGWLTVTGNWSFLKRLPWAKGTALFLLLAAPWYIAAERATPGFLQYFLIGEHFERFVVPGWQGDLYGSGHAKPKGLIWVYWLATVLPWTFLLVPIVIRGRRVAQAFSGDPSGWLLYLLFWVLSPLVLFSPAANILHAYTLPGLPAAAILMIVIVGIVWTNRPKRLAKSVYSVAAMVSLVIFATVAGLAALSPATLNLKTHKELVAAALEHASGAQLYLIGGRSYSAEFYTRGRAQVIDLRDVPALTTSQDAIAFSVPIPLAAQVATLNFKRIGAFGHRILFVKPAIPPAPPPATPEVK